MKIGEFLHRNCRNAIYPQSNVFRFPVPDNLVNWCENFADYTPVFHESPSIAGKPFADPPIGRFSFKFFTISIDYQEFSIETQMTVYLRQNGTQSTGM